jgi:hypothetical protein
MLRNAQGGRLEPTLGSNGPLFFLYGVIKKTAKSTDCMGVTKKFSKSMYEKAIFFFEIRKKPLKTEKFLKNLPRFTSKKIRAAAQKFLGTPLGKK